ncbi:MAG TPA: hypothetical protein VEX13_12950 [Chloroflexia bacterium]|nr:hypothetical protein [Chloroflexia bacterium]
MTFIPIYCTKIATRNQQRWALAALEGEVGVNRKLMDYWHDKLGLDLGEVRATYGWVSPKGDHLSVSVGGVPMIEDYGSQRKRYDAKHTAARTPRAKKVIRHHGYLLLCRRPGAHVQKGRALLVGDAAGVGEAFTGEGISPPGPSLKGQTCPTTSANLTPRSCPTSSRRGGGCGCTSGCRVPATHYCPSGCPSSGEQYALSCAGSGASSTSSGG